MNIACLKRTFCACHECQTFGFDTEGGVHRGAPLDIDAERELVTARHRTPTHRKAHR